MKLLLDQNLSRRLVGDLKPFFAGITHVTSLSMASDTTDKEIWEFARENGFAIVSKDADFHHLSFRYGPPPKTIWVKLGNCSTRQVAISLSQNVDAISAFLNEQDSALMVIRQTRIEIDVAHG